MTENDVKEVARIRHELRERLMTERHEGVDEVLSVLRRLAEKQDDGISNLRAEYERWRLRFELLELHRKN